MNIVKYPVFAWVLLILNGCSGAHISIPVGPVTIGTDISMLGDSSRGIHHETAFGERE